MTCEITKSIGAYLLGGLDYSEWEEIDRHVQECDVCRPEVVRLAGLPSLIGRLPVDEVIGDGAGSSPFTPIPRPARSPGLRRMWLAATALVIVLAGTFAGIAVTRAGTGTATATWSTAFALSGSDPATGAHGGASLTAEPWGTEVWIRVQGVKRGTQCQLVVEERDGQAIVAGTWRSGSTKASWVPASAPVKPSGITSLEIATPSGVAVTLARHSGSAN
jgi:hypothetical protein